MPISVASHRSLRGLSASLRALIRAALALEGRNAGEITLLLADDAFLRDLNRRYRKIDRATDVLSFGYRSITDRRVHGDLVISLERMNEQASRFRVTRGRELARLVIHGSLHLAGLDHHRQPERRHMRRREREALREGQCNVRVLERALDGPRALERKAPPGVRAR